MENNKHSIELQSNYKWAVKVDLAGLPLDPCLRKKKSLGLHSSDRDQIWRAYIQKKDFVN